MTDQQAKPVMQGFDPKFIDIVDYITRITELIWEAKQVGLCYDYYSDDCPVYSLSGITIGAEEVTQNTLTTLASFPDRTLHAENIIWGGSDVDGFHTSHRILTGMTHSADTDMGRATGNKAEFLVIAHCIVKDNKIIEEWLVRDNYMLAVQLGFDPVEIAQEQALFPQQQRLTQWIEREIKRLDRVSHQRDVVDSSDSERIVVALLQNIWNARMVGAVYQYYDEAAQLISVAGRKAVNQQQIAQFYLEFLGTFSNVKFSVDYVCSNQGDHYSDVAVRWTMKGNHTGSALYGEPTGAEIFILGESHYCVVNGLIKQEWTIFDELAIMTQIYRVR